MDERDELHVEAIHRRQGFALLSDGSLIPITTYLDPEGRECANVPEALSYVAGPDADGRWYTGMLDAFQRVTVH